MALDTFACPECGVKMRRSHLQTGTRVQCPRCSFQFPLPPEEPDAPPEPPRMDSPDPGYGESPGPRGETRPREEMDRDEHGTRRADDPLRAPARYDDYDRPRRRDDEDHDEDYPRSFRRGDPSDLSSEYKVDLGKWLSIARQHYTSFVGPAIGFLLIQQIISAVVRSVPFIGGLLGLLVDPPLQAGPTIVALAQIKGKRWTFGDFFGGFKFLGQTIGLAILQGLAITGAMIPGAILSAIAGVAAANSAGGPPQVELGLIVGISCGVVTAVLPAAYIAIRLSFFALPLVIDRNFAITEAMGSSWQLTRGHVLSLFGVGCVLALILLGPSLLLAAVLVPGFIFGLGAAGPGGNPDMMVLALVASIGLSCLPLLFTTPFVRLATTAAYLDVAGTEPPVSRERAEEHDRDEDRY